MKLLFENWRKYLLTEVHWKKAMEAFELPVKDVKNLILRYMDQHEVASGTQWEGHILTQGQKDKRFEWIRKQLARNIHPKQGDLIPHDLTDGQKGEAVMWLPKILKDEKDTVSHESLMKELAADDVADGISQPIGQPSRRISTISL